MGHNLRIGEASIDYNEESVEINCKLVRHDDAPAYGEPTDYKNQRLPSYTAWHKSMKSLGLLHIMFDSKNGGSDETEINGNTRYPLMSEYSRAAPITIEHVEEVERRLAAYKAKHPDHIAQYAPLKEGIEKNDINWYNPDDYVDDPRYDPNLCRGEWLAYWLRWAVENCERPVFVNS
jgi:hypothetical protein